MPTIISRAEAKAAGLTYFYTGKPCKRGHLSGFRVHNGECRECARLGALRYASKKKKHNPSWAAEKSAQRATYLSQNPFENEISTAKEMLRRIRGRAKKKNIPFSLVAEDILPLPKFCPVLGVEICYFGSSRIQKDNAASIDRIDNTKGYEPGNICIVSFRANHIKTDASLEEFRAVLTYMESYDHE